MPNTRYQVFVSSTFTDLIEERAEVMQALLELDCMPAGMELFPAANEEQWEWIKRVIDESDYYLVIVGGRYGTMSARTGLSFTEMEYRYAVETEKPVISFLHHDPDRIEAGRTEGSALAKKKLAQFRQLLEQRLCKYWDSPADLGAKVSRGITRLIKHHPGVGWVRADEVPVDQTRELLALREQVGQLRDQLKAIGAADDELSRSLARGQDKYAIEFVVDIKEQKTNKQGRVYWVNGGEHYDKASVCWDDIFSAIAVDLHVPADEYKVRYALSHLAKRTAKSALDKKFIGKRIEQYRILSDSFDVIKLQLRALGLVEIGARDIWKLTAEGERQLIKMRAVHRRTRPSV